MPVCARCGKEVRKLIEHAVTKENLCLKCIIASDSGLYSPKNHDEIAAKDDKRGSVRVPLSLVMSFAFFEGQEDTEIKYPAFSIDLSLSGICFGWDPCSFCKGYEPNGIHEQCIFYAYFIKNEKRKELFLDFKLTDTYVMRIGSYIVYTLIEDSLGVEYVGAQFVNISNKNQHMVEKIILRFGEEK